MKEKDENKKESIKYLLFIGIPVLIVLSILGAYYQMTNPIMVLSKTINTAYKSIDSLLIENNNIQDINKTPISIQGNLTFKTDLDLNGYENLQDFNYDLNLNLDLQKEFASLGLGIKEEDKQIIEGTLYQIGTEQYLESKTLIDEIIKLPEKGLEFKKLFNFQNLNIETIKQKSNDIKYILKATKEAFDKSLDKQYIKREKTDITINGRQIKTTKISYLLDKENQERTWKKMSKELQKDQEFIKVFADLSNITEEQVKEKLNQNFNYQHDYSIIIYTEGWNQNVVKVSLLENTFEQISYINYENNQIISFQNDVIFTIKENKNNIFEMDYNIKSANIKGTIKTSIQEKNKKEQDGTFYFKIQSSDINLEINLTFNSKMNQEIQIPNTDHAKDSTKLSPDEIRAINEKLEKVLKDTFLLKIIEKNIM